MTARERRTLASLGILAAIAGALVAAAGIVLAVDVLLDPAVLFNGSTRWSWGFALFERDMHQQLSQEMIPVAQSISGIPIASPPASFPARALLAAAAIGEAAVPAVILLGAARASRLTLRGGLTSRMPLLTWIVAGLVVLSAATASVCQLLAGRTVSAVFGVPDPLQLGWAFDAVCVAAALCLAIGGLLLRFGARLQHDTEGLV